MEFISKNLINKKIVPLVLIIIISLSYLPAYAHESNAERLSSDDMVIQPYFSYISIFQNAFDISTSGKASVSSYLTARDVDEVGVEASLQQNKNGVWTTIKSWSNTSPGTNSGLSGTYYVTAGYSYRLVSNGKVYKDGSLVEQTSYISEIKNY
ncbi:hypothetical protein OXPF_27150 [Oxobacter pfennigii]|uniref:Uncharacterized protein n=1 Tax=Oxobacter pfennigii TaxID=36849 RepID=A0A0P8YU98_9CLOT|nr:hypothetical protein [Oxobacter pfennigii]KPU43274.1 hypothetical protein OXPF_27150 [Oxobacter pfennigii]